MYINDKILIGKNDETEVNLLLNKANRHGIITGASGSGKTITLKVLAESFSDARVPVFLVDVKGDLAGMTLPGDIESVKERAEKMKLVDFNMKSYPTNFWDVYGVKGHPIRTTVSSLGSDLLSRMLDLTDAQEGVLAIVFKVAKDEDKEIIDLKDLQAMLKYVGENQKEYSLKYGNVTTQSVGAVQRSLLKLEEQGGDLFFGKPDFEIKDFMKYSEIDGRGYINVFDATTLFRKPALYSIFLLWLLNTLYDTSDEVGDLEKPKLVFFLDEAHLIFSEMPEHIIKNLTSIVKLIRSKGIGVYFISQSPSDIPDEILSQLGNRVQHVLRYYTKADEKSIKAACNSFRDNPKFNTEEVITQLKTGEALVSVQTIDGEPSVVERVKILPPQSKMGTIDDSVREDTIKDGMFYGKYENKVDPESAFEKINKEKEEKLKQELEAQQQEEQDRINSKNRFTEQSDNMTERFVQEHSVLRKDGESYTTPTPSKTTTKTTSRRRVGRPRKTKLEKATDRVTNTALNTVGRRIGNSIFKGLFK